MCVSPISVRVPAYNDKNKYFTIQVGCGKCVECEKRRATEWSYRILDEVKLYKDNCYVTLTYNDDLMPLNQELYKKDVQNFIKRLRTAIQPKKFRYFCCGEYGSKKGRPHYHLLLFGFCPEDCVYFFTDSEGHDYYRSKILEDCWSLFNNKKKTRKSLGFVLISKEINVRNALYCSKYMQKFNPIVKEVFNKPFTLMSRNPGIGCNGIDFNCLDSDKIYHSGNYISVPRYYLVQAEKQGFDLSVLKKNRLDNALFYSDKFISSDEWRKKIRKQSDFLLKRS